MAESFHISVITPKHTFFDQDARMLVVEAEDGQLGTRGFVTDLAKNVPECDYAFVCGPTPMLKAISAVTAGEGRGCQVSLEERMACGLGACLTCSCKVKGHYRRVCKDGPVFHSEEVAWDE